MKITYAHFLIVDDSSQRYSALTQPIQEWGLYGVTTTGDLQEAFTLMSSHSFDLVFVDIGLAARHDFAFLRRLQEDAIVDRIPLIVLAEANDMARIVKSVELGAADFLLIPPHPLLLRARINTYLNKKHLQEQIISCLQSFNEMEKLADDLRLVILPLGIALSAEKNFDRLLERIVVEAKAICNADAGTLYLRTPDDQLRFAIVRTSSLEIAYGGTTGEPVPYPPLPLFNKATGEPNHHNVATHVALEGYSINIPDIYDATGFDFTGTRKFDEENNYRSVSCLTVPLKNHGVVGVLQLLNAQEPETGQVIAFTLYHELVAESLASQAAVVLHNQFLRQQQESLLEWKHELHIGRQIQTGFFPQELPQPPGWEVVARFRPAREVAGDFYDTFLLPQGKVALIVADVCDKGVGAALFMALIRSLLRAFVQQHYHFHLQEEQPLADSSPAGDADASRSPSSIDSIALMDAVALTNAYICTNHAQMNMFATLFFGVLDPATGRLLYINCGHNPPVIFDGAGIKRPLPPTGPAVGLREGAAFALRETGLDPGDTLLIYTDGVTDARDAGGQFFSLQRLLAMAPHYAHSAVVLLDEIETAVHAHSVETEPFDDITMLAVRHAP